MEDLSLTLTTTSGAVDVALAALAICFEFEYYSTADDFLCSWFRFNTSPTPNSHCVGLHALRLSNVTEGDSNSNRPSRPNRTSHANQPSRVGLYRHPTPPCPILPRRAG